MHDRFGNFATKISIDGEVLRKGEAGIGKDSKFVTELNGDYLRSIFPIQVSD